MRQLPEILKTVNDLDFLASTNDQYWIDANLNLKKGFEYPIPHQNVLDEINGSFTEQFRNQEVNIPELTDVQFAELLNKVDLTPLGIFISRVGVDHHYHVNTGMGENNFHLKVDLKLIPTIMDEYNKTVASICFISGQITIGNKTLFAVTLKYLGVNHLAGLHSVIHNFKYGVSNHELGCWLRFWQTLTHKEHLTLLEYQSQIH